MVPGAAFWPWWSVSAASAEVRGSLQIHTSKFDASLCYARPCLRETKIVADKMFKVSMMKTLERIVRIIREN